MQERTVQITPDTHNLISIQELTNKKCRWPIGNPAEEDFGFCGNAAHNEESSYCQFHTHMAYRHNYVPKHKQQKKRAA